jgi:hypothetical protein
LTSLLNAVSYTKGLLSVRPRLPSIGAVKDELILTVKQETRGLFAPDTNAAGVPVIVCAYRRISVRSRDVAFRHSRTLRRLAEELLEVTCAGGDSS